MSSYNKDKDESIGLSVQGQYFIVTKSMIESHDWILSKMLSCEIPWEKTSDNGQIYLNVDPTSFRLVLGILNGTFDISQDAPTLSRPDLALLKSTTRYLMLGDIYKELSAFETGIVEECNSKLRRMDEMVKEAQMKINQYDRIEKKLSEVGVKIVKCSAYQTHRRFNRCGARSIIIGSASPEGHSESNLCGPCGECANDCSMLYGRRQMPEEDIPIGKSWELREFISQLEEI